MIYDRCTDGTIVGKRSIGLLLTVIVLVALVILATLHIFLNDVSLAYSIDSSIAVLELYIVVFTIFISVLGFIGYQSLVRIAESKATELVAKESKKLREIIKKDIEDQANKIEARVSTSLTSTISKASNNTEIVSKLKE